MSTRPPCIALTSGLGVARGYGPLFLSGLIAFGGSLVALGFAPTRGQEIIEAKRLRHSHHLPGRIIDELGHSDDGPGEEGSPWRAAACR